MRRATLAGLAILVACGEGQPPQACGTVEDQATGVGQTVTVPVCFQDPEGGALSLAAVSSEETVARTVAGDTAVTVTGISPGTAMVTVTATDGDGMTADLDFGVEVTAVGNLDGSWHGLASEDGEEFMSFTFEITEVDGRISGSVEAEHFEFQATGTGTVMGRLNDREVVLDFRLIGDNGMDSEFAYAGEWDGLDLIDGQLRKAGFNVDWPLPLEREDE